MIHKILNYNSVTVRWILFIISVTFHFFLFLFSNTSNQIFHDVAITLASLNPHTVNNWIWQLEILPTGKVCLHQADSEFWEGCNHATVPFPLGAHDFAELHVFIPQSIVLMKLLWGHWSAFKLQLMQTYLDLSDLLKPDLLNIISTRLWITVENTQPYGAGVRFSSVPDGQWLCKVWDMHSLSSRSQKKARYISFKGA